MYTGKRCRLTFSFIVKFLLYAYPNLYEGTHLHYPRHQREKAHYPLLGTFFLDSSVCKDSACNAGDPDWIPGLGKSTGERIGYPLQNSWTSLVAQLIKNPLAMGEDLDSIPGLGRAPGERKGYALQYSGLENSMDPVVHGVTKSRMRLSDFHFHFYVLEKIEISYLDLYSCSMMQSLSFF